MPSPLLMLHGVGLDHQMWNRMRREMSSGAAVAVPDLLGHGGAAAAPADCSLRDLTEAVRDQMSAPAHVVGFSLGALVGQYLALREPSMVLSLTCVSAVFQRNEHQAAGVRRRLEMASRDYEASVEASIERWFPAGGDFDPAIREETRQTMLSNDATSYVRVYNVFARADQELGPELADLRPPLLAVTGERDTGSTPRMSQELAATVRRGTAHVLPGVRHMLPLERPRALAALVEDFVEEQNS